MFEHNRLFLFLVISYVIGHLNITFAAEIKLVYDKVKKYQTPFPVTGIRNWAVTQNLGPTGARGYVYGSSGHTRESREILISSVEENSPADGVLYPHDIIVGVADPGKKGVANAQLKLFQSDARLALSRAITYAEGRADGVLKLLCKRGKKNIEITLQLKAIGPYTNTAPFHCDKTNTIVKQAASFLAENMPPDGFPNGLNGGLNAMFLLATGDAQYLDHVRRSAVQMGVHHKISEAGHETWRWGYVNLFLCEYYLATGDKRVLPQIEEYCKRLADGQCNPGTWGHKIVENRTPPGYGSMNQSGLICFLSLALAKECGVNVNKEALDNCVQFYGNFAGKGGIPYGDHPAYNDASSNGKNGSAAQAFNVLGLDAQAQWFGRMSCSSNLKSFEGGHTGNFFNQVWSPLGASLAGKENYQRFWKRFNSYRDLARRWDGSFITQPYPDKREGDLGYNNYTSKGPLWSTGGFALSYLALNGELAVLGRRKSVFSKHVPNVLKPALKHYYANQFAACIEQLKPLLTSNQGDVKRLAEQLSSMANRNLKSQTSTLKSMEKHSDARDLYALYQQYHAILSIMEESDSRLLPYKQKLKNFNRSPVYSAGKNFYSSIAKMSLSGTKGFERCQKKLTNPRIYGRITGIARKGQSGPYQQIARDYLADNTLEQNNYIELAVSKNVKTSPKQKGFSEDIEFNLSEPPESEQLFLELNLKGGLDVFLNGELILSIQNLEFSGKYPLKKNTMELIEPGKNRLKLKAKKTGKDFQSSLRLLALKSL